MDPDPKATVKVDSRVFPPLGSEEIQTLECLFPLEYCILIARDYEENNELKEYLGKSKVIYFYQHLVCMGVL